VHGDAGRQPPPTGFVAGLTMAAFDVPAEKAPQGIRTQAQGVAVDITLNGCVG